MLFTKGTQDSNLKNTNHAWSSELHNMSLAGLSLLDDYYQVGTTWGLETQVCLRLARSSQLKPPGDLQQWDSDIWEKKLTKWWHGSRMDPGLWREQTAKGHSRKKRDSDLQD